jgi:hypothetical protein
VAKRPVLGLPNKIGICKEQYKFDRGLLRAEEYAKLSYSMRNGEMKVGNGLD